jgi:hypothetical protein
LVDGASAAEDVVRVVTGLRLDLSERIALWGFGQRLTNGKKPGVRLR